MVTSSMPGDHPGLFPTPLGGTPVCDEFLVYNKNHCLPRFWIELAIALIPSVAAASKVATLPAAAIAALSNQVNMTVRLSNFNPPCLLPPTSLPTMTPLTLHARLKPDNPNPAALLLYYCHPLIIACSLLSPDGIS